jgi:hypothetical protein
MSSMLRAFLLLAVCALVAGCHALFGSAPWGNEPSESSREAGPASCGACHATVAARHASGPHGRKGIACGQCHRGRGHPAFDEPLNDGTCGACHPPEYQQVAASAHAGRAVVVPAAVSAGRLRGDLFRVRVTDKTFFATRDEQRKQDGRLCVGCHYDQHDLSASAARSATFCQSCHADRDNHHPYVMVDGNRCLVCHMAQGKTVAGQTVTSHVFARYGKPGP